MAKRMSDPLLRVVSMPGLVLEQCGWEVCAPGHRYGPAVRDHWLVHYVAQGKGTFTKDGVTRRLSAGDGFVIFPGETTVYEADVADPWVYYWVGFSGGAGRELLDRAGPTPTAPVFHLEDAPAAIADCVMALYTDAQLPGAGAMRALAGLVRFLAYVAGGAAGGEAGPIVDDAQAEYLAAALRHVQAHYADGLTVEALAAHVGIDRSHLFRVFKSGLGMGPQQYIVNVRVRQAARLLTETTMPMHQVAGYAGFSSPTHLGVAFRRAYGTTPGAYRAARR